MANQEVGTIIATTLVRAPESRFKSLSAQETLMYLAARVDWVWDVPVQAPTMQGRAEEAITAEGRGIIMVVEGVDPVIPNTILSRQGLT